MAIRYGRSKHMDAVTIQDCLKFPIWTLSPDDSKYAEEGRRPITNKIDVDHEVLKETVPIITFRVADSDASGFGFYDHPTGELTTCYLWKDNKWIDVDLELRPDPTVIYPLAFIAIPTILGKSNVRFVMENNSVRPRRLL